MKLRSHTLLILLFAAELFANPTVTITAPVPSATEAGVYPGLFRIERSGDTSAPLPVQLAWSGTATPGEDYETGPASIIIPAGSAFIEFSLLPINDPVAEADPAETVVATLQPNPGYTVGSTAAATVTLTEDETLAQTTPFLYSVFPDSATSVVLRWLDLFETETRFRVQFRPVGTSSWTTWSDNLPANTTQTRVTGLTTAQPYEFRVFAFQGSTSSLGPNPAIPAVPIPPDSSAPAYSTFEQWRRVAGLATSLRGGSGGSAHDPDRDGVPNLLEYALGGDPLLPDRPGLALAETPSGRQLSWPHVHGLLDIAVTLRESADLLTWTASPLATNTGSGMRSALDTYPSDRRFYRLEASPSVPVAPSARIVCWGDSLTGNPGTYAEKLPSLLPGRTVLNCGIGGDTSTQIRDRMHGLQITSPTPAYAASTPAGTPVRIVASRTVHTRIMDIGQRGNWARFSSTIANVSRVEFFNRGIKIGESSTPLAATVASNRTANSSRLLATGHPFANGNVVHFPTGPLPAPLVVGKTYYVLNADTDGFALSETTPSAAPIDLAADFATPATLQGHFFFDWTHPGGPTDLTLRTHTDRDNDTFILWMGRNNNARPHEVYAHIRAAVEHIKTLNARFLVVSVTNGDTGTGETIGNPYYIGTVNLNYLLRQEFPDNFVDVRTALIRAANSSLNDQTDRAADIPPVSLRSDTVHFNDAGQTLIAELIAAELTRRGW